MTVDLFIPCDVNQFAPDTAWSVVRILEYLGIEVNYVPEHRCCGLSSFENGHVDHARQMGTAFLNEFSGSNPIVCPSLECSIMIRNQYPELFFNTSLHNKAKAFQSRVWELSEFVVKKLNITDLSARFENNVYFFAQGNTSEHLNAHENSLTLLNKVKGITVVSKSQNGPECCFGGGITFRHPEITEVFCKYITNDATDANASVITSNDFSCLRHLQNYIEIHQLDIKTVHLAEILSTGA
jgi:L-lactate dehydrogenase complex protein LldE